MSKKVIISSLSVMCLAAGCVNEKYPASHYSSTSYVVPHHSRHHTTTYLATPHVHRPAAVQQNSQTVVVQQQANQTVNAPASVHHHHHNEGANNRQEQEKQRQIESDHRIAAHIQQDEVMRHNREMQNRQQQIENDRRLAERLQREENQRAGAAVQAASYAQAQPAHTPSAPRVEAMADNLPTVDLAASEAEAKKKQIEEDHKLAVKLQEELNQPAG